VTENITTRNASITALETYPTPRITVREIVSTVNVTGLQSRCSICGLREACLPCDLMLPDGSHIEELITNDRHVERGEYLYRTSDEFTCLYTVRSGFFKTVQTLEVGREQVTGFHMTGDMLGADGIGSEAHCCDAIALEDSHVCVILYSQIMKGWSRHELRRRIQRAMSGEIVREHSVMLLLGTRTAEERLAAFLLNLSERLAARGYSPTEFILRMARQEIASYLGMNDATVSRQFSKFRSEGLISVQYKHIQIRDIAGLKRCIGRKSD